MDFLVFGTGAIGVYIGGSLVLGGHRVTFFDRPEPAAQLNHAGLWLTRDGARQRIPGAEVLSSLDQALDRAPAGCLLFAIKSYDTATALEMLAPLAGRLPPLLCLQNGVDNEPALVSVLGAEHVIAGTVTTAISRPAPGEVVEERRRGVGIAGGHSLSDELVAAFTAAGLNARLYPAAAPMKWSKLLTNLLGNATSAILDLAPVEIFADQRLVRLEVDQLREALAVMHALGLEVVDLPGTPVRALAFAVRRLPVGLLRPFLKKAVGGGRGAKMPSLHIDLYGGRNQSEVDYLNGAVVHYGEKTGLSTPVNRVLNEILLEMAAGDLPRTAYAHQPEILLQALRR